MSPIEAIILGVVQGLTEFLPISSSGHLKLAQALLGFDHLDRYIFFDLICHLGTLGAILLVFFTQIKQTLFLDRSKLLQVILGTLPLFPLVLILKPIKALFNQPQYLGYCFMLTAALLYLGIRFGQSLSEKQLTRHRLRDPLLIGLSQAVAILPGISRSGTTISVARVLGWNPSQAVTFSFMLAIPAILGAITLELLQLFMSSETTLSSVSIPTSAYLAGFTTSLFIGYLALRWLLLLAVKEKFIYFVWYCLLLGIASTVYFN